MANNPLFSTGNASIRDNEITLDLLLKEPTRITNLVNEIVDSWYWAGVLFRPTNINSDALVYTVNQPKKPQKLGGYEIAPGSEFPQVNIEISSPQVVRTAKIGGRFSITDEALSGNNEAVFTDGVQKSSATIARALNQKGIDTVLDAVLNKNGTVKETTLKVTATTGWRTLAGNASSNSTTAAADIRKQFIAAETASSATGLQYNFDTLILNNDDALNFKSCFKTDAEYANFLEARGLTLIESPLVPAGKGLYTAAGQVGIMGVQAPLSTEQYRDPSREITNVQTRAQVAFAITDPAAIVVLDGINA